MSHPATSHTSPHAQQRVHGGADARGAARWDFSTCANAAGPCPTALAAVQAADATRYPDPAARAVRQALAALHGVEPERILLAASASEFIQRITAVTGRLWPGAVQVPRWAYGDYAVAAAAWGRACHVEGEQGAEGASGEERVGSACRRQPCTLRWYADPTSPMGLDGDPPDVDARRFPAVLDAVYAPLRLQGTSAWTASGRDAVFVLHSPNKALGLTGVRGAYAVAPAHDSGDGVAGYDVTACRKALQAAAPSWPLSAHADAMLRAWALPETQAWVADSHAVLAGWKSDLLRRLSARGFEVRASVTPYAVVRPRIWVEPALLREHEVGVRDTSSFGLPGWWRVSVQAPAAQDAFMHALDLAERRPG
ncbi:aminotransferase class I/II-fold pyridoxal phosphate-dependent enzyme [Piscinibacter koreensis]|uniref:aminotransferase class I/II-fold pyridoxal phosphate-dependent enzyme n=1 Tax=Piscinibacter koreensis TaxID=2742824 RepID=UPI0031580C90